MLGEDVWRGHSHRGTMIGMPFCQNCGEEVPAEARWCRSCGHTLATAASPVAAGYQAPVQAGARRTPGNATASLVLGLVGLVVCPIVCSVLALVFGYQAKREIRSDPGLQGDGMATAGIVLGYVGLVLGAIVFVVLLGRSGST